MRSAVNRSSKDRRDRDRRDFSDSRKFNRNDRMDRGRNVRGTPQVSLTKIFKEEKKRNFQIYKIIFRNNLDLRFTLIDFVFLFIVFYIKKSVKSEKSERVPIR